MLVNIITIAVVTGFQNQVKDKVVGFNAHAVILNSESNSIFESSPIIVDDHLENKLLKDTKLKNFNRVAYKAAILQSEVLDHKENSSREIQGVLLKGIEKEYDFNFIQSYLVAGRIPKLDSDHVSDEILISRRIAQDLHFKVGDEVRSFVVKSKPVKQMFKVVGIFDTGLEEFDKQVVFADLRQIQRLNDWGIQTSLVLKDTLHQGRLLVMAETIGGSGRYLYDWGQGFSYKAGYIIDPFKDTTYRVRVKDEFYLLDGNQNLDEDPRLIDESSITFRVKGEAFTACRPALNSEGEIQKEFLDEEGYHFKVGCANKSIEVLQEPGKGTFHHFIGAYELNYHFLDSRYIIDHVRADVEFDKENINRGLRVDGIEETQKEIFVWLSFLDLNVTIILVLMILIGIINMGSAILVLILTKSSFIGLFKALGSTNWQLRKMFLLQAAMIIFRGMLTGNVLGLGLCFVQQRFALIKLNPEIYYLNAVPISISWTSILWINVVTFVICVLAMIVPSAAISKVSPSKAMKF